MLPSFARISHTRISRTRILPTRILPTRILVAALTVVVAGACGSAATPHASSPTSNPKLSLAKATARTGAADAAVAPGAMPIRAPMNYVLDGTLPDLGAQAPVYRWTAHSVDLAEVNRLAGVLGITSPATATTDGFTAGDSNATLTVTTNYGATQISYYPGGANSVGGSVGSSGSGSTGSSTAASGSSTGSAKPNAIVDPVPPDSGVTPLPQKLTPPVDVPNATDAEKTARALLDQMGVLDGQQWDSQVNDSGGIAISCAVGADCSGVSQPVAARDVSFTLMIDGKKVNGITWYVTVGEHSRIDSLYGEWGSADVLGTYDLRSTSDAFAALQKGDANFGGVEPVAIDGGAPVSAQVDPAVEPVTDTPSVAPPVPEPTSGPVDSVPVDSVPVATVPVDTTPVQPIDAHVTGVSLGLARWDAVDGNQNVIDLVPTYEFHVTIDGSSSDMEELALDPGAIDFANPVTPPTPTGTVPVPEPGTGKAEPLPAPAP